MAKKKTPKELHLLKKLPGKPAEEITIADTMEALQEALNGGYVTTQRIAKGVMIICDEDAQLKGLPPCCNIEGHLLAGPVLIAGARGPRWQSLPADVMSFMKAQLS